MSGGAEISELGEDEFDAEELRGATTRLRVLLVEDDAFVQELLVGCVKQAASAMLPHAAVDVKTCETAAGALAVYAAASSFS